MQQLGRFELDNIYNEDCYKAIKDIPDKSVNCIYTDIPYLISMCGGGKNRLSQNLGKLRQDLEDIIDGIDYSILDDFVRVMKRINIFIWCSKLQIIDILNYFNNLKEKVSYEILVWTKTNPIPATNNTWLPDVEYCLYFRSGGAN